MDPAHRDRIAFLRICSGKVHAGMKVLHHRIGKELALSNATIFMAQDRAHVEEAYPGDIIGIHNHGTIKVGDTFTIKEPLKFTGIPNFAPEHFRRVRLKNPLKTKQLTKGLYQLAEEGAVQVFRPKLDNSYILGAVGILQFDVTMARLKDEYGVDACMSPSNMRQPAGFTVRTKTGWLFLKEKIWRSLPATPKGIWHTLPEANGAWDTRWSSGRKLNFSRPVSMASNS